MFGLLGPNGAGKTTTVEILEGYRKRDGGDVEVLGEDPERAGTALPRARRRRPPVVVALPEPDRPRGHALFAGYYPRPRDIDEVIQIVGLTEKADARVQDALRRAEAAARPRPRAVGDPELIFLDEPTTGFDPGARRAAWEPIRPLRSLGTTILLTTHYLDEAEQLADRVAVLRAGRDRPRGLAGRADGDNPETEIRYRRGGEEVVERHGRPTRRLHELTAEALERGEELEGLEVRRPTLEDVYLELIDGGMTLLSSTSSARSS